MPFKTENNSLHSVDVLFLTKQTKINRLHLFSLVRNNLNFDSKYYKDITTFNEECSTLVKN